LASCVGKFQPKIDAVCDHCTISVGAERFHVIHMCPLSDVVMRNSLLGANLCQANPIFGLQFARAWQAVGKLQPKIDAVCEDHGTISVGAEPFHVIHMSPMSDVVMRNSLLGANPCQANPIFGLQLWPKLGKLRRQISAQN
jgi:hypothetical protein